MRLLTSSSIICTVEVHVGGDACTFCTSYKIVNVHVCVQCRPTVVPFIKYIHKCSSVDITTINYACMIYCAW